MGGKSKFYSCLLLVFFIFIFVHFKVGGQFTAEALPHMAERGRMAICGVISEYNDDDKDSGVVAMTSRYFVVSLSL